MNKDICIVVPIYNEEKIIDKVIEELKSNTKNLNSKLILINDGSKDATLEKLRKYENDKNIFVINKENEGHGKTILKGYEYAIQNNYKFIFQIDSDDQFYPGEIVNFIQKLNGEKLLIGKRVKRKDQFIRLIITNIMKLIIFFFHGVFLKDANCPFRLIEVNFLSNHINKIQNSIIPNVLISILAAKEKSLKYINVSHKERKTGEVSIKKWKLLVFCFNSFKEIIFFK